MNQTDVNKMLAEQKRMNELLEDIAEGFMVLVNIQEWDDGVPSLKSIGIEYPWTRPSKRGRVKIPETPPPDYENPTR